MYVFVNDRPPNAVGAPAPPPPPPGAPPGYPEGVSRDGRGMWMCLKHNPGEDEWCGACAIAKVLLICVVC